MRNGLIGKGLLLAATVAAVLAAVPSTGGSAGAATGDTRVVAYGLRTPDDRATCELVIVDATTGTVAELPAAPAADACAFDLAVAPNGTVYGVDPAPVNNTTSIAGAATTTEVGSLVTYAADGTATRTPIAVLGQYSYFPSAFAFGGGIAVDGNGTLFVIVNGLYSSDVTTCAPGLAPVSTEALEPTDGRSDFTSCLFTLDPATGTATLIGPSTVIAGDTAALSIGSDATRTFAIYGTYVTGSVSTSEIPPVYWATVDRANGAVTNSAVLAPFDTGLIDSLRTRTTVWTFAIDPDTRKMHVATLDPTTGAVTLGAVLSDQTVHITSIAVAELAIPTTTTTAAVEPEAPRFAG